MRMTAFLMLIACLHVAAKGVSQGITLSVKNEPLKNVFRQLSKQTGISVVFNEKELQNTAPVSLEVTNAPVQQVLDVCLKDQPLSYTIENNIIVIEKKKANSYLPVPGMPAADTSVNLIGFVNNENNKFIAGVTITIKGTMRGTTTDEYGKFALPDVPLKATLIVSSIGYLTQEVRIDDHKMFAGKEVLKVVTLKEHISALDETVIMAYGTTTKRKSTGNITSIKGADIARQPVMNPLLGLQGRVPGLEISPTTGYEFGPVKVEVRGRNSINPNFVSDPLYIVDGVPLTTLEINGGINTAYSSNIIARGADQSGILPTGGVSPLFALNSADIASIEVLKDADATAIYGSRGANGVILINTKRGKPGKTQFNVGISQGINVISRKWDMLNTQQYLAMRREAFKNDGITPSKVPGSPGYAPDLLVWDTTRYTDWQKYLWGGTGKWTNAQAEVAGGTDQTTFRVGMGYNRSTDITTVSGASQRASVSLTLTNQSRNQRFNMIFSTNYSNSKINMMNVNGAASLAPNAPGPFDSKGNLNWVEWKASNVIYPFFGLLSPYTNSGSLLASSMSLGYKLFKGLEVRTTLGYNKNDSRSTYTTPISSQDPFSTIKPTGRTSLGTTTATNWQVEPQLEYNKTIHKNQFNVLLGGTLQTNKTDGLNILGSGYTSDALLGSLTNAPVVQTTQNVAMYKYAGLFGRIGYSYADKYYLNLNGRRDGSSRFGPGKQFGNFGSAGAAWIISDEKWMQQLLPAVISFIKFRGSYGITGTDAAGDYKYLSQWGNDGTPLSSYNGVTPLVALIMENPDFHWQVNKKLEGAIDLGFFDDQVTMEVAWYRNRCNNQLVSYPTPMFTGFPNVVANLPANVQNSGIEYSLNARIIEKNDILWMFRFNISANRNKLIDYPGIEQSPYYNRYRIGSSLDNIYLYNYMGIDPQTGKYMYEDWNHDGKITADESVLYGTGKDDRYYALSLTPKYGGSFGNDVRIKNWTVSMDFVFSKRIVNNALANTPGTMANIGVYDYEHRWQQPGDVAETPRLSTLADFTSNSFSSSIGSWTDGSYIRFRTISLSYRLPDKVSKKAGLTNLAANIAAQNIFTITGYKGLDPDIPGFGAKPPMRTVTAGITCSF